MSSFTQKERDEESARRKAADLARDMTPRAGGGVGPKAQCIHCQRVFSLSEGGHMGEVSVCDRCLHSG